VRDANSEHSRPFAAAAERLRLSPGPARERIGGWEFLRTPVPAVVSAKLPWARELKIISDLERRLDEVITEVRPAILHAHSPALNALSALRAGRRHRVPVVYEMRSLWEDAAGVGSANRTNGLRYRATRFLETRALRGADAVTTICQGLRKDMTARGIPPEKITVIPNAVDRHTFAGPGIPDHVLAARLGLTGKTVLAFFGSFYFYEGLHLLLRALPALLRWQADIAILLVGGGPEDNNLREMARDLGLEENVVFAGRVAHEEMQRYYDLADLFVLPRVSMRLTELVTPLKPLEAMAQERIVVASNVGGHRELIRDRQTGYLFPPNDPERLVQGVLGALADRPSWPRIRARAIEFIDTERSWTHSVARYAEVYARVLGR